MNRSTQLLRRKPLAVFVQLALPAMFAASLGHAATCTVNSATDDPATASANVTAATISGTLRDCILAANLLTGSTGVPTNPGMNIVTTLIAGSSITLGDSLPMIFNNTTIGGSGNPVVIDGGSAHRMFFVSGLPDSSVTPLPDPDGAQAITVGLSNLTLQNGKAQGGTGAGAGMGAGGALFVNKNASVTLSQVDLKTNTVVGGGGGSAGARIGGGGIGANAAGRGGAGIGGNTALNTFGGGGAGTDATNYGGSLGGTGTGQISNAQGFAAPAFGGGATYGSSGGIGGGGARQGAGGFGAGAGSAGPLTPTQGGFGGGGAACCGEGGGSGSSGGFGGGGGAPAPTYSSFNVDGSPGFAGGNGAFGGGAAGGGGGGTCSATAGSFNGGSGGLAGLAGVGGGAGAQGSAGTGCIVGTPGQSGTAGASGGGAGLGGAVFVRAGGTLTLQSQSQVPGGSAISGNSATAGVGANNGAAVGNGAFLMTGATTTFDIGTVMTVSDNLADDSPSSLPGGSYTPGSGAGAAITKQGLGTLILSGTDTYAGATTVTAGALQVDGVLTTSPATINGGTLSGTGTVQGVTLNGGAFIAPGDSPGTLHGSNLTWNGGGAFNFQLGATNSTTDSDLLALSGALTKGTTGAYTFHFSDGNGAPALGVTYTLITFNGPTFFVASDFSYDYAGANAGLTGTFAITGSAPPAPSKSGSPTPKAQLPPNTLTFTPSALPVRLQSFEVD